MIEILIGVIVAFFVTFFLTPYAIRYLKFIGLVTTDIHKFKKTKIPYPAGLSVSAGLIGGLLVFVFFSTFLNNISIDFVTLFAGITSILIISFTGFLDDINSKQKKEGSYITGKIGLKTWQKPLLTIPAAIPLMVIMAGNSEIYIPILGSLNFGILFPLLLIPIGVVVSSNMVNMLGGYNFLQIGMGIIITFGLGLVGYLEGNILATTIFFITSAALLGVSIFNKNPAKILSGDVDSYLIGAVIIVGGIIGNIERAVFIMAIPFFIQAALKFYGRYKLGKFPSDTGIINKKGIIKSRYGNGIYSWTHLIMKIGNITENKLVSIMLLIQTIFVILPLLKYIGI